MNLKILALAASGCVLAAGAAHAGEYGAPPYSVGGYAGYDGGGCEGFTLAGAHAGVTVLGISVGGGASARIGGGGCGGGYQGAAYAPSPVYQGGYPQGGGYYPQPAYAQPAYAPVAYPSQPVYAPPSYGYPQQGYGYGQPCGCQGQPPVVYQPY